MSLSVETGTRPDGGAEPAHSVADVVEVMGRVRAAIEQVIEGKREAVDLALVVLLAEGHPCSYSHKTLQRQKQEY